MHHLQWIESMFRDHFLSIRLLFKPDAMFTSLNVPSYLLSYFRPKELTLQMGGLCHQFRNDQNCYVPEEEPIYDELLVPQISKCLCH